jgi:hypothetical protein
MNTLASSATPEELIDVLAFVFVLTPTFVEDED